MHQVFADFADISIRPELGLGTSIPLGREDVNPELASLHDGEAVLLVEWGELQAVGTAKLIERDGYRYWYGLLRREDIQPVAIAGNSGRLTPEEEAIFEEVFDPNDPDMLYLKDK